MKGKKAFSAFLSAVLLSGIVGGTAASAQTNGPVIEWYIPHTLKVGDWIPDVSTDPGTGHDWRIGRGSNLDEGATVYCLSDKKYGFASHARAFREIVDGQAEIVTTYERIYKPGLSPLRVSVYDENDKFLYYAGEPYEITVEEPVIKTNAPQSVVVGQTLPFTTELTNTSLENVKVAPYLDPINYDYFNDSILGGYRYYDAANGVYSKDNHYMAHEIAYLPKVEVLEGKDLVEQSNQDYSNILNSSETLTFTGAGTIKLKITYQQIMTCECLADFKWNEDYSLVLDENNNPIILEDYRYSPTATVTINVTEPPVSLADEETGIRFDAEGGVVPGNTALRVEKLSSGDKYVMVGNALKEKAQKFEAFDISLLSNGNEVQPDGKVKITMPVPSSYVAERLAVCHIADDGTLAQVAFTLSGDKKSLSFETDHFSIYTLAELKQQSTTGSNDPGTTDGSDPSTTGSNNPGIASSGAPGITDSSDLGGTTDNSQGGTGSPETGETTVLPLIVLMIAAMIALGVILFRKRGTNE